MKSHYSVKAPGDQRLIGFVVRGIPPDGGQVRTDVFALSQVAQQLAAELIRLGWTSVDCFEHRRNSIEDELYTLIL